MKQCPTNRNGHQAKGGSSAASMSITNGSNPMPTANEFTVRKEPAQLPIPVTEPLHLYINQLGVKPGAQKLEQFKQALRLRAVPAKQDIPDLWKATAYVKLFDPCGNYRAYITEWCQDEDDGDICFGFVTWHDNEWGPVSLSEMADLKGPLGIGFEIDTHFKPEPMDEVLKRTNPEINTTPWP
jgi:hypothetical protein